jgi:integrase
MRGPVSAVATGLTGPSRPNPPAATGVRPALYDRMPVVLPPEARDSWLDPTNDDIKGLQIAVSPCEGVRLPPIEHAEVVPLEVETVAALAGTIDLRYRGLVVLGAGSGVRISEALGLTVDRIDFLRGAVTINRQLLRGSGGSPVFGPVKDRKNRARTIPVGSVVLDAFAEHLARYGPGPEGLVFSTMLHCPVAHSTWSKIWQTAALPLGIPKGDGFHQLRHFYASILIGAGCTVKEVQERLGHTSAAMTLDVYSHLWPSDEDRTRSVTIRSCRGCPSPQVGAKWAQGRPESERCWSKGCNQGYRPCL